VTEFTRPSWRGVLHTWAFAVSLITGTVLVVLAEGARARVGVGVYAVTVSLLFGTSALYHRLRWGARGLQVMRGLDHSMIFVFIAGSYTPFALLMLPGTAAAVILTVVWGGAVAGVLARLAWRRAPRWFFVPLYLALGWVAVFVLPELLAHGGVVAVALLVLGGAFYSLGGVVYAARRPNPRPAVFGFHEVFHACTLVAAVCHYAAVVLALYAGPLPLAS